MKNFKTIITFLMIFTLSFANIADTYGMELKPRPGYGSSKHRKRGTTKRRGCNGKRLFNPFKSGF
jgi:hypothetical protein